jgi:hypothetical protein
MSSITLASSIVMAEGEFDPDRGLIVDIGQQHNTSRVTELQRSTGSWWWSCLD